MKMLFKGSDCDLPFQTTLRRWCLKICEELIVLGTTNWGHRISHNTIEKKQCLTAKMISNYDIQGSWVDEN